MTTAVYLLSIPLARHRSIVAQRRDAGIASAESSLRPRELRVGEVADRVAASPVRANAIQRINSR